MMKPKIYEDEDEAAAPGDMEENTDGQDEGNAVYDMFCNLPPDEQTRVLGMMQAKLRETKKSPMTRSDDREFRPLAKGDV